MAADRPNQTLADYVTIVFSPVLIMGLVGSLVFFLLELFYRTHGEWRDRLQWIVFFFVFGAVLTARISMMGEIADRASLYGSILALLTYIALQRFVEYPAEVRSLSFLVNLVLVAVVWWCAHRLTWDCTNVDEDTDMSGEGLLQAAGLEETPAARRDEALPEVGSLGWFERYRRYREQRRKKRTLGVWIVYFSLAALPIFGLGQALLPLSDPERRRRVFWLMTVYVACGLGLLLTTCFLGLRRYLRQKRLQMPAAMTGLWLLSGGGLILILLLLGALLPRPHAEYPLRDLLPGAAAAKRQANRFAMKGDSPGEGRGQPGAPRADGKAPGDQRGKPTGQDRNGPGGDKGDGKGDGKGGEKGDGKGDQKGGGKGGEKGEEKQGGSQRQGNQAKDGQRQQADEQGKAGQPGQPMQQTASSPPTPGGWQQALERLAPVLKGIVFVLVAVFVIVAVLRGVLGYLTHFTDWARRLLDAWRRFWDGLLAPSGDGDDEADDEADEAGEPPAPFRSFSNPFDGDGASRSPRRLVRYTFAAVEALARERGIGRGEAETAAEFLDRLGEELPALEDEARRLAALHARVEYSAGGLPASAVEQVRAIWDRLDRLPARV